MKETINKIIALSILPERKELLALEEATNEIDEDFLKGILIVDGTDQSLLEVFWRLTKLYRR